VASAVGDCPSDREAPVAEMVKPGLVRAAGGVVHRRVDGVLEVLIVHRPRYDDWSIPKGKCEPGESDEQAALREVREETGLTCVLEAEIGSTSYVDHRGRDKRVRFFLMRAIRGEFTLAGEFIPNDEVDEVAWLTLDAARGALSAAGERDVIAAAAVSLAEGPLDRPRLRANRPNAE
jgi:8-oxo-dGTP pyrophosphatase MutT (NUDIX family)